MPRGSNNKGRGRFGGRTKGTPNRTTVEKTEIARIEVERAKGRNVKLGKEVLEEFMMLFAGMAARYQPLPVGMEKAPAPPGRDPNEPKFIEYATLTVKTARDLADFQSPKLRAVVHHGPFGAEPQMLPTQDNVITITDAVVLQRVYSRRVKQVR